MRYVELHARSAFSFLRGASQPERLAAPSPPTTQRLPKVVAEEQEKEKI